MTINDKLRDEKLQCDFNREATDKYEFLTVEEILPPDQSRIIGQAEFLYSPLGKAFEKQIKTIEDQGIRQVKALKALKPEESQQLESIEGIFPKKMRNIEIKNELKKTAKI